LVLTLLNRDVNTQERNWIIVDSSVTQCCITDNLL